MQRRVQPCTCSPQPRLPDPQTNRSTAPAIRSIRFTSSTHCFFFPGFGLLSRAQTLTELHSKSSVQWPLLHGRNNGGKSAITVSCAYTDSSVLICPLSHAFCPAIHSSLTVYASKKRAFALPSPNSSSRCFP